MTTTKTCDHTLARARPQVATAICTVLPIWESRAGLIVVVANMVRCRPAVDEAALAELKADLEKPHMARVPGARAVQGLVTFFPKAAHCPGLWLCKTQGWQVVKGLQVGTLL